MSLLDFNDRYRGLPVRLLSALSSGQVGQSYIFSGDSVDELKLFIDEWVKTIICSDRNSSGACGECRNCLCLTPIIIQNCTLWSRHLNQDDSS